MKIKLVRTGGFIPVTKAAEGDLDLSDKQLTALLGMIQSNPAAGKVKDGNYWEITVGNVVTPVDLEKIPDEYRGVFDKLKGEMKIVK